MNIDRLGTRMLLWFGVISQFKENIVVLFNINELVDVVLLCFLFFECAVIKAHRPLCTFV